MPLEVSYTERFRQAFGQLGDAEQARVVQALELFMSNPRHPSLRLRKLTGQQNIWYMRASRDLRITLENHGDTWLLRVVGPHDKALRQP